MNSKPLIVVLWAFLSISAAASENFTADPLVHFRSSVRLGTGDRVVSLEVDLNGDGLLDRFVSADSLRNGASGNIWECYVAQPGGGFVKGKETVSFPTDMLRLAEDAITGEPIIVSYQPDGVSHGVITKVGLSGGSPILTPLEDVKPSDSEEEYIQEVFKTERCVSPQYRDPATVRVDLAVRALSESQAAERENSTLIVSEKPALQTSDAPDMIFESPPTALATSPTSYSAPGLSVLWGLALLAGGCVSATLCFFLKRKPRFL